MTRPSEDPSVKELVIVTGPSGAGRSTAISALEDLGFEAIDNLPLSLVPRLWEGQSAGNLVALGIDTRSRNFSVFGLSDLLTRLAAEPSCAVHLVYLDCREDVLLRRFSETRRRHPLGGEGTLLDSIRHEIDLLAPLRARADVLICTSDMSPHDLRAEIARWFGTDAQNRLSVNVLSFSYKRGLPRGADLVFDCRFLDNPHWQPDLRAGDGRDPAVAAHVQADARYAAFFERLSGLVGMLLPAYRDEGRSYLTVALGCTGGRHRSVVVAAELARAIAAEGWGVSLRHRELGGPDVVPQAEAGT